MIQRPRPRTIVFALALIGASMVLASGTASAEALHKVGLSRGEYLAHIGDCVACHTQHGGEPFAGGFAMPMQRGRVRILPGEAIGSVFPGVAAPALPAIAGMVVATGDGRAALRPFLAGVAHRDGPEGALVLPEDAGGAALLFT